MSDNPPNSPDKDPEPQERNADLSEEDKRFLESDFAKDVLASPEFRQMFDRKRSADIAKAAISGREIPQPEKDDKAVPGAKPSPRATGYGSADGGAGTGTRVPGQTSDAASERGRQRREREKIEAEVVETMHPQDREKYNDLGTPEERRAAIFETYKEKLDDRKRRDDAAFRKDLARTAKAQDLLHTIKTDPSKAHLPWPINDSKEALLEWYEELSKPVHVPSFGNPDRAKPGAKADPKPLYPHSDPRKKGSVRDADQLAIKHRANAEKTVSTTPALPEKNTQTEAADTNPKANWLKVIIGVLAAFLLFYFAVTAAFQNAGVVNVWVAYSMIAAGWLLFMLSIGVADYYLPLAKRTKIKLMGFVGALSLLFALGAGLVMSWLKAEQQRENSPQVVPTEAQEHPDISLKLVHPNGLAIIFVNESDVIIREPKYIPAMWNFDRENWNEPLPVPVTSGDWIRAKEALGPQAFITQPRVGPLVKQGDRLFGIVQVTCPNCVRTKAYWVYAVHGVSGWYSEMTPGYYPDLREVSKLVPKIRQDPEKFFADIPLEKRIEISETY
jgi:hypothetical protein